MIDELRAERKREGELSRALVVARHRRAELRRGVTILIKTFPAADRRRLSRQLERVETLRLVPRRRPGATERSDAVLAFLAECPGDEFVIAELDRALAVAGYYTGRDYASQALHRLVMPGLVVRFWLFRYLVSHQLPSLLSLLRHAFDDRRRLR